MKKKIYIKFTKYFQTFLILIFTPFDVTSRAIPSGINAIPMAKKAGSTVPAVRIGCHAGNFCCLNFVSAKLDHLELKKHKRAISLINLFCFTFDSFLLNCSIFITTSVFKRCSFDSMKQSQDIVCQV